MIKIGTVKQFEELKKELPQEVKNECLNLLEILEENYGEDRDVEVDLGGFVAILESKEDFEELIENNLDVLTEIAEDIAVFNTENAKYFMVLYLLSSDFAISIIVEKEHVDKQVLAKWEV